MHIWSFCARVPSDFRYELNSHYITCKLSNVHNTLFWVKLGKIILFSKETVFFFFGGCIRFPELSEIPEIIVLYIFKPISPIPTFNVSSHSCCYCTIGYTCLQSWSKKLAVLVQNFHHLRWCWGHHWNCIQGGPWLKLWSLSGPLSSQHLGQNVQFPPYQWTCLSVKLPATMSRCSYRNPTVF